jgi:putative phosphoesterase
VHGNLAALEAVLAEVERESPDRIVICGDVADGPFAGECVERLRESGALLVQGNADREAGESFEPTVTLEIEGLGPTLFCHGSPRSDLEIMTSLTPEADLRRLVAGVTEDVLVCGHTHVQFDRRVDAKRVVNCGSVGMPYEGKRGAFWAVLGPDVELRRTEYDVDAAVAAMRASGWDDVYDLVPNLLEPPDPREVEEYFEGVARERGERI